MLIVIIVAHRFHVNPDNIATPIAGSLGDCVTLSLLASTGTLYLMIRNVQTQWQYANAGIICAFLAFTPIGVWIASKEKVTRSVLKNGWIAVVAALFISR
jgi:solute carrier family 41